MEDSSSSHRDRRRGLAPSAFNEFIRRRAESESPKSEQEHVGKESPSKQNVLSPGFRLVDPYAISPTHPGPTISMVDAADATLEIVPPQQSAFSALFSNHSTANSGTQTSSIPQGHVKEQSESNTEQEPHSHPLRSNPTTFAPPPSPSPSSRLISLSQSEVPKPAASFRAKASQQLIRARERLLKTLTVRTRGLLIEPKKSSSNIKRLAVNRDAIERRTLDDGSLISSVGLVQTKQNPRDHSDKMQPRFAWYTNDPVDRHVQRATVGTRGAPVASEAREYVEKRMIRNYELMVEEENDRLDEEELVCEFEDDSDSDSDEDYEDDGSDSDEDLEDAEHTRKTDPKPDTEADTTTECNEDLMDGVEFEVNHDNTQAYSPTADSGNTQEPHILDTRSDSTSPAPTPTPDRTQRVSSPFPTPTHPTTSHWHSTLSPKRNDRMRQVFENTSPQGEAKKVRRIVLDTDIDDEDSEYHAIMAEIEKGRRV